MGLPRFIVNARKTLERCGAPYPCPLALERDSESERVREPASHRESEQAIARARASDSACESERQRVLERAIARARTIER